MKTCSKCGVSKEGTEFHSGRPDCKECRKAYDRAYYIKNKEGIAAHKKAYYAENKEEIRAYNNAYYAENKEERRPYQKTYRAENKEGMKAYRAEHQEEIKTYQKIYRAENKKTRADYQRKYNYGITPEEFDSLLTKCGGACAICGSPGDKRGLFIDHDHTTGKIRELICGCCNSALGYLKDSSEMARAAMKYLVKHGK